MAEEGLTLAPRAPRGRRRIWAVTAVIVWLGAIGGAFVCWGLRAARDVAPEQAPAQEPGISSADYTEPEKCSDCHPGLYAQWTGTMHSFAATDPVYVGLYVLADKQTDGQAERFCAASLCHAPVGHLAGEIPPVDGSRLSPMASNGVFCDFCHTVGGAGGLGNGRYLAGPGPVKRGPYADATSPFHRTAYSKLHTSSEFCALCHNVSHPVYGTKLETTYDEWRRSPYYSSNASKRTECQDCHMGPRAPRELGPKPGRAALGGPARPSVFSHDAAGANVVIGQLMGDTSTAARARSFLRSAARIDMDLGTPRGGFAPVTVRVTNVGAGHDLPTGVTEIRQVWVELTVTDAGGRVVYSDGVLDGAGEVPKGTRVFHTVFGDKDGKPTDYIWFATKILKDDRIPPKQTRVVRYRVPLSDARRPVRISARLLYRSMQQYLADLALGRGRFTVPVVEMARIQRRL